MHENINVIFEEPTTNVILAVFEGDRIVGASHIDTVNKTVFAVNSDNFDLALPMAQKWCQQHKIDDPTYKLVTSVL